MSYEFNRSFLYKTGDIVLFNNITYICTCDITGNDFENLSYQSPLDLPEKWNRYNTLNSTNDLVNSVNIFLVLDNPDLMESSQDTEGEAEYGTEAEEGEAEGEGEAEEGEAEDLSSKKILGKRNCSKNVNYCTCLEDECDECMGAGKNFKKKKYFDDKDLQLLDKILKKPKPLTVDCRVDNGVSGHPKVKEILEKAPYLKNFLMKYTIPKDEILYVLNSEHDIDSMITIISKIKLINEGTGHGEENEKEKKWLNKILRYKPSNLKLNIPSDPSKEEIRNFMTKIKNGLDEKVEFMEEPKQIVCNYILKNILNEKERKVGGTSCIAIQGPPGVGKTELLRSLSSITGIPFFQINMGGMKDSNILTGHSLTYVGSSEGVITKGLIESGCKNPIILIDEIDKISDKDVVNTLIHILDKTQNCDFTDNYFRGVKFDLSNAMFFCSLNNLQNVDPILLDRLHVIKIPEYSGEHVLKIMKHIIKRDNLEFVSDEYLIGEETVNYIYEKYFSKNCEYKGVRMFRRIIDTLIDGLLYKIYVTGEGGGEGGFDGVRREPSKKLIDEIFGTNFKSITQQLDEYWKTLYM